MSVRVQLNIFSGRENPMWTLPENFQKSFFDYLSKAKKITVKTKPPPILGYRGVQLFYINTEWSIWNGIITVRIKNTRPVFYEDPNRALEKIILVTVPEEFRQIIPLIP